MRSLRQGLVLTLAWIGLATSLLANPWEGQHDWETSPELYPGLRRAEKTVTTPQRAVMHVLRVDLEHPDIRLHTTGRHADWGQPMPEFPQFTIRTGRQTTRDYLNAQRSAGLNMVAAINAAPWKPWSELSDSQKSNYAYADRLGLAVSQGQLVSSPHTAARGSLLIYKNWTAAIFDTITTSPDTSTLLTAVSGFQVALNQGVALGNATAVEPRTGLGLGADQRYLVMLTVDGRQSGYSDGATVREVGEWLRHFGSDMGLNMDGGGSTTMVWRNPANGSVGVVNRPSTRIFNFSIERTVGNNLGVYYVGEPEPITLEDWLTYRGVPGPERGASRDANGDGWPNLLAYILNIHPVQGLRADDVHAEPRYTLETGEGGQRFLAIEFRVNRHAVGVNVVPEQAFALDADSWGEPVHGELVALGPDPVTHDPRYRMLIPAEGAERLFVRLRAIME